MFSLVLFHHTLRCLVLAGGKKVFFFEKTNQKTFGCFGCGFSGHRVPKRAKVFWSFFSKQNRLLLSAIDQGESAFWIFGMEYSEIRESFLALGLVTIKRMFGGNGVYFQDHIIAVEYHGDILLKADDVSAPAFEAAGAVRWADEGKMGKAVQPSRALQLIRS